MIETLEFEERRLVSEMLQNRQQVGVFSYLASVSGVTCLLDYCICKRFLSYVICRDGATGGLVTH